MLPAWIAAGMQLIGANVANNRAKIERRQAVDDVENQFVRLRAGAEKAGYNPLAVLGMASGIPASTGSSAAYMGQAIADTGLMIADGIANAKSAKTLQKVTALETQNQALTERLTRQTLRPKIGGVYEQPAQTPTLQSALGRPDSGGANSGPAQSDQAVTPPKVALKILGEELDPVSNTSDAESGEARYGEIISEVMGIGALAVDLGAYMRKKTNQWGWTAPGNMLTGEGRPPKVDRRSGRGGKYYEPSQRGDGYDRLTGSRPAERFK